MADPDAVAKVRAAGGGAGNADGDRSTPRVAPRPPQGGWASAHFKTLSSSTATRLPLQAFTDHYYATFDSARANLAALYQDQSMLTFEGQKFMGTQAVSALLECPEGRADNAEAGGGR